MLADTHDLAALPCADDPESVPLQVGFPRQGWPPAASDSAPHHFRLQEGKGVPPPWLQPLAQSES